MTPSLDVVTDRLSALAHSLLSGARLNALRLLGEPTLDGKRDAGQRANALATAAGGVENFLFNYYQVKHARAAWPEEFDPVRLKLISSDGVDTTLLRETIARCDDVSGKVASYLLDLLTGEPLLAPAIPVLSHVLTVVETRAVAPPETLKLNIPSPPPSGTKVVHGPVIVATDPAFTPTFSLLQRPVSAFGDAAAEAVPYFWSLAVRESLAAELCALSMVEYDGLPLPFYMDMSKQAWDEMRHSTYFFDQAVSMLDELEADLHPDDPLLETVRTYRQTGVGLPIPRERNLYEAILNATLIERLILLHRDTETPGIIRIRQKLTSAFCKAHPEIEAGLRIVMRDEVTHARFGNTWLEHLVPDAGQLEEIVETTQLLRGVLLLSSFAHHGDERLETLMAQYSSGTRAPVSALTM